MIDRRDAHLVRIGSLQDDRRPVAEDLGDAFGDRLRDPDRLDVAREKRAGIRQDLRASGLKLELLLQALTLGDVAERDNRAGDPSTFLERRSVDRDRDLLFVTRDHHRDVHDRLAGR